MDEREERVRNYVLRHRGLVARGFEILRPQLEAFLTSQELEELEKNIKVHDASKLEPEELVPRAEFYHGEKNAQTRAALDKAEKRHKLINPHHPEFWRAKNQEMPRVAVVEMVLDWWTFGLGNNDPEEIFDYYEKDKQNLRLTAQEEQQVMQIFAMIKKSLEG